MFALSRQVLQTGRRRRGAASVKASATIGVISEEGSQMLGACEDAMAPPRLAGSFKVKIHRTLGGS
jgi:hypothetical protein